MADGAIDKIPEFEFYCPLCLRAGGVGHDDSLQGASLNSEVYHALFVLFWLPPCIDAPQCHNINRYRACAKRPV